jgi:hypothetical protein
MQALLLKLHKNGTHNPVWKKDYGDGDVTGINPRDQGSNAAIETYDASIPAYGYVGAGITHPDKDDCFDGKTHDFYAYETTDGGVSNWNSGCELTEGLGYGGSKDDNAYSVLQLCDGNYLIVGATKSKTDDVECNNQSTGTATFDAWVIKINAATGELMWEEVIGDVENDEFHDIEQLEDGSFIAVGEFGTGISVDLQDFYIVKFELSECAIPSGLAATTQSGCAIKFDWEGSACAREYELKYRTLSSGWTTVTTTLTEFTTGALSPATYQWKVKAKCSPNVWSDFTDVSYHTLLSSCRIDAEAKNQAHGILSTYPQPSDGLFHLTLIHSSNINLTATALLEDFAGRIVDQIPFTIENGKMDLQYSSSNLSPGLYFVTLAVEGFDYRTKLVIQKP